MTRFLRERYAFGASFGKVLRIGRLAASAAALGILGSACKPDAGTDPDTVVIFGGPTCRLCEIVVEEVAVLGHVDDAASFRPDPGPCVVGQLSTGEFVSSGLVGGGQLFVYDKSGRAVRTIGRKGEGPGELKGNQWIMVGPMDTLFVLGWTRLVAFGPGGKHVESRSFRIPWTYWSFARLRDGGFVFHTPAHTIDGPLIRVLDANGAEAGAHGNPSAEMVKRQMPDLDYRGVSSSISGGYWTSNVWTYEMSRWRSPGVRDMTVVRHVEWFRPNEPMSWEEMDAWYAETPPPRRLYHIREDAEGLLWTYTLVPDERWDPEPEPDHVDPGWILRTYDTVIEVIDIRSAKVLADYRHDERLSPVCGRRLVSSVRENRAGDTRAVVFRLSLRR